MPRHELTLACFLVVAMTAGAQEVPDGVDFFETHIRPVLVEHCYHCHAADAQSKKGGLLLDTKAGILAGGESGAAVIPNNPDESLLGVRFIEITHRGWDQHKDLSKRLPANCRATDRPIAALLGDLKERGMLDDTLVLWSGEFGRQPTLQNGDGRGHNHRGYSMWMAGGGIKGGMQYGATDETGLFAQENKVHTHDLHATILHQLGINHKELTYRYSGRDFRLTDVYGNVVTDIVA